MGDHTASPFKFEIEFKNIILVRLQIFEFSHSLDPTETLRGLLPRVLRLGPRRLFARPGCLVVDRDTRRTQPGQQYSSYRGRIESNILGVWWMCLAALQSERQVQLLAKVPLSTSLLAKKRVKLVAIAVTNTMARIAWAIMAKGGYYRAPEPAAAA